jgi:hypothetical protein
MELWTQLRPRTRWGMKIGTLRIAFTAERGFFVRSRHGFSIAGHLPAVKHSTAKLL